MNLEIHDIFNEIILIGLLSDYFVNILDLNVDKNFGYKTFTDIVYVNNFNKEFMISLSNYENFQSNDYDIQYYKNIKIEIHFKNDHGDGYYIHLLFTHQYDYSTQLNANLNENLS